MISEIGQNIVFPLASQSAKKIVNQSIVVFDLKGVNIVSFFFKVKKILKISNRVLNNFYPETLLKLYIVHAGKYYEFALNIMLLTKHIIMEKVVLNSGYFWFLHLLFGISQPF